MTRWTDSADTVELPTASGATTIDLSRPRPGRGGPWRELSGALALGISVLAVVVMVFQVLAWVRDMPGPGIGMVAGHVAAAVLAVVAQRFADRGAGWVAAASTLAVAAVSGATLWFFWWA